MNDRAPLLISFLGLPRSRPEKGWLRRLFGRSRGSRPGYELSAYRLGTVTSEPTTFPVVGLATCLDPRPAVIKTLGTAKAWGEFERVHQSELERHGLPLGSFEELPSGDGESDAWAVFEVLNRVLTQAGDRPVVLDVTNGFRVQMLLAAASVLLRRALGKGATDLKISYAAWEARDRARPPVTPIWDVTAFLDVVDWTQALSTFLHTGHAGDWAAGRLDERGRSLARSWAMNGREGPRPGLTQLGRALEAFSADLLTLRTGDLLLGRQKKVSSADALLAALRSAREDVGRHVPALAAVLEDLESLAAPLGGLSVAEAPDRSLADDQGHAALVALARLHLTQEHHAHAAIVGREALICRHAEAAAARPGREGFQDDSRRAAERAWARENESGFAPTVASIRNTLAHAGFQRDPAKARPLVDGCKRLVENAAQAKRRPPGAPRPAPRGLFANLTNHESAGWEEAQRAAAAELAEEVYDLPFPHVEPDWTEEELDAEARRLVAEDCREGTTHALVMGEYALTVRLVLELQRRGITCLVTRQRREVVPLGDGRREQPFTFLGFREYPYLA